MPVTKGRLKPEDYRKIQKNFKYLCEEVDAKDLGDKLFQEEVITLDDLEEIGSKPSKGKRTSAMLFMLLEAGPGHAYQKFLEALEEVSPHVAERLEQPLEAPAEQASPWSWYDSITSGVQICGISDADLNRIASCLSTGWENVMLRLGLNRTLISQEEARYPRNTAMAITNLLIRWRQRKSQDATLECLMNAIQETQQLDVDIESLKPIVLRLLGNSGQPRVLMTEV